MLTSTKLDVVLHAVFSLKHPAPDATQVADATLDGTLDATLAAAQDAETQDAEAQDAEAHGGLQATMVVATSVVADMATEMAGVTTVAAVPAVVAAVPAAVATAVAVVTRSVLSLRSVPQPMLQFTPLNTLSTAVETITPTRQVIATLTTFTLPRTLASMFTLTSTHVSLPTSKTEVPDAVAAVPAAVPAAVMVTSVATVMVTSVETTDGVTVTVAHGVVTHAVAHAVTPAVDAENYQLSFRKMPIENFVNSFLSNYYFINIKYI